MSTTEQPHPLVEALRRKTKYQDERIEELETTIAELNADIADLRRQIAEAK